MKKISLLIIYVIASSICMKSQTSYFERAHRCDTINRVLKESFYFNHKMYFVSKHNATGPILNVCDSNGVNLRTVELPSSSFSIGNFDFRNGYLIYATQNSVYKIDSLGNVVWHTYVQNNCAGGGTNVSSKFLKNGSIIVFGASNSNLVIIRLNPLTGAILGNPINISINSANPGQVPNFTFNFYAQGMTEFSNSSVYFLLTRRDNGSTYTENYVIKCANDTTFNFINGIVLDNVVTNNNAIYGGNLTTINSFSNEILITGAEYNGTKSSVSILKIDSNLTVQNTRYPIVVKNIGSTIYSYNPAFSTNNNRLYIGAVGAPNGNEFSLMCFNTNLNLIQWTGYNLDNQNTVNGLDCSILKFKNAGGNGNKLLAVASYTSNSKWKRSVLKTDISGTFLCGSVLTPTLTTDSLHSTTITASNFYGANATSTNATTSTLSALYSDSTLCLDIITAIAQNSRDVNSTSIYPNPTKNNLTITSSTKILNLKVINCIGQVVMKRNNVDSDEIQLDLSTQPEGIYFIQLNNSDGNVIKKIIKE